MTTSRDLCSTLDGWHTQLGIWSYAVIGDTDAVLEPSAVIAERGDTVQGVWDRTAGDLEGSLVSRHNQPYRRVPDWWAFRWLPERWIDAQLSIEYAEVGS